MCLIEIKLTKRASEKESISFLYAEFKKFFVNSQVAAAGMRGKNYYARIYVHFPENHVSAMCQGTLSYHSKIEKISIVS